MLHPCLSGKSIDHSPLVSFTLGSCGEIVIVPQPKRESEPPSFIIIDSFCHMKGSYIFVLFLAFYPRAHFFPLSFLTVRVLFLPQGWLLSIQVTCLLGIKCFLLEKCRFLFPSLFLLLLFPVVEYFKRSIYQLRRVHLLNASSHVLPFIFTFLALLETPGSAVGLINSLKKIQRSLLFGFY